MADSDPIEVIMHLLRDEWDSTNTHDITPKCHSGWYDFGAGGQQVTVTTLQDVVFDAGPQSTGYTALGPDGRGVQHRGGTVDVNAWPGTRDESPVNPKDLTHKMKEEIHRILKAHDDGIIDGTPVFNSLAPGMTRRLADDEGPYTVYRHLVEAQFTYHD